MSYQFVSHTGELAVKVAASDLSGLFAEAARAMTDYLLQDLSVSAGVAAETLELRAPDANALLVGWLSEILYRVETKHRIYRKFEFKRFTDTSLEAAVFGQPVRKLARDIKAVTHHGLKIEQVNGEYEATIVFDV